MLVQALHELGKTSSILKKKEILKSYADSKIITTAFKLACDPDFMVNIKKLPKLAIGSAGIETFNDFVVLLKKLNSREISGNKAIAETVEFLENCDLKTQDAYVRILKKDLRVNVSDTLLRDVYGEDFIFKLKIQLANTYDEEKNYGLPEGKNYWYASRKLDGLRGFYKNFILYSRNGKPVNGFKDMEAELEHLVGTFKLKFVDGELFSDTLDFQTISSFVRKTKNVDSDERKQIYFNVFAVGLDGTTEDMVNLMRDIDWSKYKYLRPVSYYLVQNDPQQIKDLASQFVKEGFEGIMLRHPVLIYDFKRSNALLKFKFFKEADFEIRWYEEGEGRLKGTLGKFIIEGHVTDGGFDKHIACEVGSGFNDEQRKDFWKRRKSLIGVKAEIKYQNITDKPSADGLWALRFPIFLKLKEDR